MAKDKRIVRHPWGRKGRGGWIIQPKDLMEALKDGDVAEFGKLRVGARQLAKLIALLRFPDHELLVKSNGQLEVQNLERYVSVREGNRRTEFRQPRLRHSFTVCNKAWIPSKTTVTVIIKPRKFK